MSDQPQLSESVRKLTLLALDRTAYTSERDLLAWMRTSVSLYTFGFAITKFLDYLVGAGESGYANSIRRLGLFLIGIGILSLVLPIIDHLRRLRIMRRLGLGDPSHLHLPVIGSGLLLMIGLFTMGALIWG